MQYEIGGYETYCKNQLKKEKQQQDQDILDAMLRELKAKNDLDRQVKIAGLKKQLQEMRC